MDATLRDGDHDGQPGAGRAVLRTLEARDWDGFRRAAPRWTSCTRSRSPANGSLGRDRYVQFNSEYPGDWHLAPKMIVADEGGAGVWFDWTLGDGEHSDGVVFIQVNDGLITRVTDFWPEPYDPPPGREHLVEHD